MNGELEFFGKAIVYASLFCIGMGLVTIYHQCKTRPPLGIGLILTVSGVIVLILLVAEAVYRSPVPVEVEVRSVLYLAGLMVTSCGLVLMTVATRLTRMARYDQGAAEHG